jgi:chromosome partitioning protein
MHANSETRQRDNMKTIAVISHKGSAGKTTVAIRLDVAAGQRGLEAALFDLDPQASAASWSEKRQPSSPTMLSNQSARLLKQAQAPDLVIIDSGPNPDGAR